MSSSLIQENSLTPEDETMESSQAGVSSSKRKMKVKRIPKSKGNQKQERLNGERSNDKCLVLDLDRHCGVIIMPSGIACTRSLTCKSHSMASKRSVAGRSVDFDFLLSAHMSKLHQSKSSAGSPQVAETPVNTIKQQKSSISNATSCESLPVPGILEKLGVSNEDDLSLLDAVRLFVPCPVVNSKFSEGVVRRTGFIFLHQVMDSIFSTNPSASASLRRSSQSSISMVESNVSSSVPNQGSSGTKKTAASKRNSKANINKTPSSEEAFFSDSPVPPPHPPTNTTSIFQSRAPNPMNSFPSALSPNDSYSGAMMNMNQFNPANTSIIRPNIIRSDSTMIVPPAIGGHVSPPPSMSSLPRGRKPSTGKIRKTTGKRKVR